MIGKERGKLQVNHDSTAIDENSFESRAKAQKELVETLKVQWKLLWSERFNDKLRAEGISISDYEILNVERGTIIHATRDYRALNFKEILDQHRVEQPERFIQPNVNVGGWNKFVKTKINTHKSQTLPDIAKKIRPQQPKKSGRGWLHAT